MTRLLASVLVGGLSLTCLAGVLLWTADRAGKDPQLSAWARAHGLLLTDANRPMVSYYLVLGRVLRTLGGLGGMAIAPLVRAATGLNLSRSGLGWAWILAGYLAGAMWAELFLTRPAPRRPSASLAERRLPAYLPARLQWGLRAAGAASLAAGVAALAIEEPAGVINPWLSPGAAFALGLAGAAVAGLVELLQVVVVRRPQPVVAADLVAADDAIRASSVHNLAGAGLGMVLLIVATVVSRLIEAAGHLPFGLGAAPLVLTVAGLMFWRYYSHRAWRVRRPVLVAPAGP